MLNEVIIVGFLALKEVKFIGVNQTLESAISLILCFLLISTALVLLKVMMRRPGEIIEKKKLNLFLNHLKMSLSLKLERFGHFIILSFV